MKIKENFIKKISVCLLLLVELIVAIIVLGSCVFSTQMITLSTFLIINIFVKCMI